MMQKNFVQDDATSLKQRMATVETWISAHDALCANRYWWILAWIKITAAIIGVSTVALIGGMWQVIEHLEKI